MYDVPGKQKGPDPMDQGLGVASVRRGYGLSGGCCSEEGWAVEGVEVTRVVDRSWADRH